MVLFILIVDSFIMHSLRLYLEHSVLHLFQGLLHLFYLIFRHYKLCDFKGNPAEAHHIPDLKGRAHFLKVLEDEPTVLFNDDLGIPLVHLIWKGLTDVIIVAMVHNIE